MRFPAGVTGMKVELAFDLDISRNGPPGHMRITTISDSIY
jgi:hypothetical protein